MKAKNGVSGVQKLNGGHLRGGRPQKAPREHFGFWLQPDSPGHSRLIAILRSQPNISDYIVRVLQGATPQQLQDAKESDVVRSALNALGGGDEDEED